MTDGSGGDPTSTFDGRLPARVHDRFLLADHAETDDLVFFGAPRYGGDPLRFLTGSDAEGLSGIPCDLALVARGSVR
ncbi:MAG: hypothetical protein ACOC0X_03605 [Halobacteriota archaeon]